jgi:hypothetical protein
MRALIAIVLALSLPGLSACTAMMVGGGATYEAPAEDCEKDGSNCKR